MKAHCTKVPNPLWFGSYYQGRDCLGHVTSSCPTRLVYFFLQERMYVLFFKLCSFLRLVCMRRALIFTEFSADIRNSRLLLLHTALGARRRRTLSNAQIRNSLLYSFLKSMVARTFVLYS